MTGIVCHIRARSNGGPRFDARQTDENRHGYSNLILMCARHSKLIDSDPRAYPADLLQQMKSAQEKNGSIELREPMPAKQWHFWRTTGPFTLQQEGTSW